MKTSNKLLIGFATALLLIPILGMVIVSRTHYKKGTQQDRVDVVERDKSYKALSKNMTSVAISAAFETVNVADAKNVSLNIHFIKDEQFGVKISNEYKELITAVLDANGVLQISMKDKLNDNSNMERDYAIIYVYSPNLSGLTVANANNLIVKTTAEKLKLNLNNIEYFYFDNGTTIKQLDIDADKIKNLTLRRDKISSANVVITDTEFAVESMNLDSVSITTNGASKVIFYTTNGEKTNQVIKNLVLNTNGKAEVKMENTTINNCSGKLSDETLVEMPAVNINQMYKK